MFKESEVERQFKIIAEGCQEIVPQDELKAKLKKSIESGIPLKIKMGIDPTSADVHIGHMVVYNKIRQLQDLGHEAHLIIGDYTARIGDPTGRNTERPPLTEQMVKKNAATYKEQIFKIVDPQKTTFHFQSSWFDNTTLGKILQTASKFSVAHMLSHETFKKRLEDGNRLSLHEMFYPVLQAWDSVEINADIEFGGMDQKFNILCGRDLQKENNQEQQIAIFMPLLLGSDGRKMSKSFNNHIPVLSEPSEKFGKVMSIKDEFILDYFKYTTNLKAERINEIEEKLQNDNPRDIKILLAKEIIKIYHSEAEADRCENEFINVFSNKGLPDEIPQVTLNSGKYNLCSLLKDQNVTSSISEAKINQGGLKLDGIKIVDEDYEIELQDNKDILIKAGKRKFLKLATDTKSPAK